MHFAIFHSCLQVFYLKNSIFLMRQVACFHYLYIILRNIAEEIALSHSRSPAMVYVNLPTHIFLWFLLRTWVQVENLVSITCRTINSILNLCWDQALSGMRSPLKGIVASNQSVSQFALFLLLWWFVLLVAPRFSYLLCFAIRLLIGWNKRLIATSSHTTLSLTLSVSLCLVGFRSW